MKPFLSFLFAIAISFTAIAQPAITVRVDTNIAITDRNITTKTGARSITPLNVGYAIDSVLELVRAAAALVASTGDLQATTDLGPNTTNDIFVGAGTVSVPSAGWLVSASGQYISGLDGTTETIGLRSTSGSSWIYMLDAGSSNFGRFKSGVLTDTRTWLGPDEGDGVGLDATLVLHSTADPITVGATAGQHVIYGTSTVQLKNASTLNANLGSNTNGGFLTLRDAGSGFSSILKAHSSLTGPDTSYMPPVTGVLACRRDTVGDAFSDMPKLVTETGLATAVAASNNFTFALATNADYTIPGTHMLIELPTTSAPRNVVMPTVVTGAELVICNLSANPGDWTFTGVSAVDCAGLTLGALATQTAYRFIAHGTIWRRVN